MILAFVAVSATVSSIVENFLVSQRTQEQANNTERTAFEAALLFNGSDISHLYDFIHERAQELEGRILILDTNAVVQADSASQFNGYFLPYREVRDILTLNEPASFGFHKLTQVNEFTDQLTFTSSVRWVVYYTAPITIEGATQGVLLFASSIQDVVDSVKSITYQIAIVFILFAIGVGLVSFATSDWITRPIIALTNAIRRMSSSRYSQKVKVKGKGEIAELSEAFNRMSEQLESHDRLRDEFVSNASHELKTPLSTMKILAESMIYQDQFDAEITREFFMDIDHEIDRLTHIINDLLHLVQEDRTDFSLKLAPVQLNELIQTVINRLRPLAQKKQIALECRLVPILMDADALRMEQVITNLVDNAIKYTDQGSILVTLRTDGTDVEFTVKDTGIGIPKEAIGQLFERFYRVDKARSRQTGGTGLGLSIVERIVSLHGGYIRVESEVGSGSVFTVSLPIKRSDAQPDSDSHNDRGETR